MTTRSTFAIALCVATLTLSTYSYSDVSEAVHILNGSDSFNPIDEGDVSIFLYKPDFQFKIIGTIEARGMAESNLRDILSLSLPTEKQDMQLAIRALKQEAASIGANGVIIVKQGQVRISETASERRIIGAAIRY